MPSAATVRATIVSASEQLRLPAVKVTRPYDRGGRAEQQWNCHYQADHAITVIIITGTIGHQNEADKSLVRALGSRY